MVSERFAHQTGGIFMLRIEDTDKKEVEGAWELVVEALDYLYGSKLMNDKIWLEKEIGNYGPYKQSARENIYAVFIKRFSRKMTCLPLFLFFRRTRRNKKNSRRI